MLNKIIDILKDFFDVKEYEFLNIKKTLLQFSIDERNYVAEYNKDDDPGFFRVLLPKIESIDEISIREVKDRMITITSLYKVGKAISINNEVWLSAEVFISSESNVLELFTRMLSVLNDMYKKYNEMRNG